jgi:DNA primase
VRNYTDEIIDEIRNGTDIVDVISEHITLKKQGRNYVGLCPFHPEKTPSFSVSPEKQIFYCFGCGVGGDVFSFLMKKENISFPEALSLAAERIGLSLDKQKGAYDGYLTTLKDRKKKFGANRQAALYYHNCLVNNKKGEPALKYFETRGLTLQTIKSFGLGFALPDWEGLKRHLLNNGYSEQFLIDIGLLTKTKKGSCDRFYNRVMFPILDTQSRVIGFGGRVLDKSLPKYLNSPETRIFSKRKNLYGLNFAKDYTRNDGLIIVEGYMDVIALHQYGIKNAVASLGTSLTSEQAKLIKKFTNEVIIAYDADTAGQSATIRGLDILKAAGLNVKVLELTAGDDPDEFIRREGKDAFLTLVKNSQPLVDYKIKIHEKNTDFSTLQGRISFMSRVLPILEQIQNEIEKDAYIKRLSARLKIAEEPIRIELSKISTNKQTKHISTKKRNNIRNNRKDVVEPAFLKAEKALLNFAISNKNLYLKINRDLSASDFIDETNSSIFRMIDRIYKEKDKIQPYELIDHTDESTASVITEVLNRNYDMEAPDKIIDDCLKQIKVSKIRKKMEEIKAQLKTLEDTEDLTRSRELLLEYQQLLKTSQNM